MGFILSNFKVILGGFFAILCLIGCVFKMFREISVTTQISLEKESTRRKNHSLGCFLLSVLLLGVFSGCNTTPGIPEKSKGLKSYACNVKKPSLIPSPWFGGSMKYLTSGDLGKVGMLYTSKAGYIDMGHFNESVNRTRYFSALAFENIMNGRSEFSFRVIEPPEYLIQIKYPANWSALSNSEKEKIAKERSIRLGQYLAQISTVWHEMITWYGYSSIGLFSEKPSSFSWEDLYSDFLGANLTAEALIDGGDFVIVINQLIDEKLQELGLQSMMVAKAATKKIKGKWYRGFYPGIKMKRNFDIGTDGSITPWLVPGVCKNKVPVLCPAISLNSVSSQGFEFDVKITPRGSQGKKLLKIIYPSKDDKSIVPVLHYDKIVTQLLREAKRSGRSDVNKPVLTGL